VAADNETDTGVGISIVVPACHGTIENKCGGARRYKLNDKKKTFPSFINFRIYVLGCQG